jgi:hypothetical protein
LHHPTSPGRHHGMAQERVDGNKMSSVGVGRRGDY